MFILSDTWLVHSNIKAACLLTVERKGARVLQSVRNELEQGVMKGESHGAGVESRGKEIGGLAAEAKRGVEAGTGGRGVGVEREEGQKAEKGRIGVKGHEVGAENDGPEAEVGTEERGVDDPGARRGGGQEVERGDAHAVLRGRGI